MQTLYSEFLNEYELLQHMEEVKEDSDVENGYYLSHHGVLRLSSKTTRLRVVFNANAKTSSGLSLNDLLCKGGVIQEDLFSILITFREYAYAFTADIRQMFRMIEINPSQTKLQKILWKNSKTAPTKVYELKTVTYGTASAPYLATRVLQQLALDEEKDFPLASEVLLQDFYMDDCLSGASELSEFEKLKSELTQLLQRGGMTLHKWCSNKAPSTELREFSLNRSSEEVMVKTLCMLWDSSGDSFTYKVTTSTDCKYTKRDVLSQIARIYDPLGLLGPVIAIAKIFMQQLWLLKLDWNETLPPDVSTQWRNFIQTLKDIESIHVPRCFLVVPTKFVVLNGFADASSKAYGAVFYVQTNEITNQLLCSKSRLAPIKSMTIPILELCSCLRLAKLIHKVKAALKMQINSVNLYSDSTIALAWINSLSNLLKTFFSNRVSQIQQLSRDLK
ncbi:integrase catalytic domain-containing protein [Trichonephila clavipes]|nr:integrase catalytic domain-containing protein [Trichonephila clavipes]